MIKKSLTILVLVIVARVDIAQDIVCFKECVAASAFSAENIHRIRSLGVEGPWDVIDFRWHKTEPILFMLSNWRSTEKAGTPGTDLEMWEYGDRGHKSRNFLIRGPFTQLEVTPGAVVSGTDRGSLLFGDIKQEEMLHEFQVSDGKVSELLLHPSKAWLLVGINNAKLYQIDLESRSAAENRLQGAEETALHALSFSSNGKPLAVGGNETIWIWETGSWETWGPQRLPNESIEDLIFTEDDSHLIVLTDASVSRWSLANERLRFLRKLVARPGKRHCRIADGDISPDGSLLMTTDTCGQSRAWDLAADQEIYVPQLDFSEDSRPGTAVVFSPDGRLLAEVANAHWVLLIVWEPA